MIFTSIFTPAYSTFKLSTSLFFQSLLTSADRLERNMQHGEHGEQADGNMQQEAAHEDRRDMRRQSADIEDSVEARRAGTSGGREKCGIARCAKRGRPRRPRRRRRRSIRGFVYFINVTGAAARRHCASLPVCKSALPVCNSTLPVCYSSQF